MQPETISVDGATVKEGDETTIDGLTGDVYLGRVPTIDPKPLSKHPQANAILSWADAIRRLEVWANADYPRDAIKARENGAQGVGLCRTEHMFMEQDRLPIVQAMALRSIVGSISLGLMIAVSATQGRRLFALCQKGGLLPPVEAAE